MRLQDNDSEGLDAAARYRAAQQVFTKDAASSPMKALLSSKVRCLAASHLAVLRMHAVELHVVMRKWVTVQGLTQTKSPVVACTSCSFASHFHHDMPVPQRCSHWTLMRPLHSIDRELCVDHTSSMPSYR